MQAIISTYAVQELASKVGIITGTFRLHYYQVAINQSINQSIDHMMDKNKVVLQLQRFIQSKLLCYFEISLGTLGILIIFLAEDKPNYVALFIYIFVILTALLQLLLNYTSGRKSINNQKNQ